MTTRVKLNIEGTGELEDGTVYSRKLSIRETTETSGYNTFTKEVTEEAVEISGEVCKVNVVRINGEKVEENVEDATVRDHKEFEKKWEEINWRWSRVLAYHVPGVSANQDTQSWGRASGSSGASGIGASGCCCAIL